MKEDQADKSGGEAFGQSNRLPAGMPKSEEKQAELFAVAVLLALGCRTKEIMKRLRMPRTRVSRYRAAVHRLKLFKVDLSKAPSPLVVERARRMMYGSELFDQLRQLSGGRLKFYKAVVIGEAEREDAKTLEESLGWQRVFARKAAPLLEEALTNAQETLVTYGRTLEETFLLAGFKQLGDGLRVYSGCCDPYEYVHENWSSSRLAAWVLSQQGRSQERHPSLVGMLPIISPQVGLRVRQALAMNVENAPDYQFIYGPEGVATRANCLITSIGRSQLPWTMGDDYFAKATGLSREEIHSMIEVEIGSVPLARKGLNRSQRSRFNKINACRLGLRLEHVQAIARLGGSGPSPGVVVLALGADKAACFLELVKRGLINSAIVDNSLELALKRLLGKIAGRKQGG